MNDRPAFRARFVYESAEGLAVTEHYSLSEMVESMEQRGFEYLGLTSRPGLRLELQQQPRFKGVAGPMWDGDAIRYESPGAYAALSI